MKPGPKPGHRESANPYPAKRQCECEKPAPLRDTYGEVRCHNCGHPPRPAVA